jgi:hypothetical protein
MQIIVYYIQNGVIYSSRGNRYKEPYLEALLSDSGQDTIQAFYNLDYAVACLCKLIHLTETEVRQLWINPSTYNPEDRPEKHGRIVKSLSYDGSNDPDSFIQYELNYYPKTMFQVDIGIGRGRTGVTISDMSQYMNSKIEPNLSEGEIFRRLDVAQNVAQQVYDALVKLNLRVRTLTSPIRAYQNTVMPDLNLPTWKDCPDEVSNYYYQACTGGWVEALKLGHFEMLYDFDLNSAYPLQLSKMPDFRAGEWQHIESMPTFKQGSIGIMQAFYNPSVDFHPIIYKDLDGRNFTPSGEFPTFLTWNKLNYIREHNLGEVKVIDGWIWTPNKIIRPLKKEMDRLYEKKQQSKGIERDVIKRCLVGVYGLTGQTLKFDAQIPFGPYFNPVWRAEVENNTQLRVYDFCLKNGITPIAITTDGVLTDKKLEIESSTEMGGWKLDSATKGLVMGSGCIALQGKQKEGDFSLNYDKLIEIIKADPTKREIVIEKEGFISIGEAVERNLIGRLGEFEMDRRSILLDSEIKRIYPIEPANFGELLEHQYDSIPLDISMIESE